MKHHLLSTLLVGSFTLSAWAQFGTYVDPEVLDACPGYEVTNIGVSRSGLKADLILAGTPCNVFGDDISQLRLDVTYETDTRIHVKITDPSTQRYEVPESVLPRPGADGRATTDTAQILFNYTSSPFSFTIIRSQTQEVLFDTTSRPLIFEPQYLRVKTRLPEDANVYGLGEHTEPFRLPVFNTTRTLWSRDSPGVPTGTNLYGNHPIYFEHRETGTHAVLLANSNGMDIKINNTENSGETTLEYNIIGGVLDFYFLAGGEDPVDTAKQYSEVVGTPAEVPYWSFGLHQCRYGYTDFVNVADVITNYSKAEIPLETMWTDIDYMNKRWIFSNDPQYFPTDRMREIVNYLHAHDQQYILMTDPAVAYQPGQDYGTFDRGIEKDVFLKNPNGSLNLGIVWPGVAVFPDWFNPNTQDFWSNEFVLFFNPETGIDIDGAWIDMNEPSSFCEYPCTDPFGSAREQGLPPNRTTPPPDPNAPIFGESVFSNSTSLQQRYMSETDFNKRHAQSNTYLELLKRQHAGDDLFNPPYGINNAFPELSERTAYVDVVHSNGLILYDTHNLFGTMMSMATRNALLARRPGLRPLVITRSTFAGAGNHVGKWLGDNISLWEHYRFSIAGMLGMATIYQVPMVGSDICGFEGNTTESLCARWAMLGAFYPFMRNHNNLGSLDQEFYLWPTVTQAAKNALDIRYRLIDYIYTAFHRAHLDGTPILNPLWFKYPTDSNTFDLDLQFFFGDSILVSPITEENKTSVEAYFPNEIFYDFQTLRAIGIQGSNMTLNANLTEIPLHIRGGSIIPLREMGTMTTKALRNVDFEILVAPNSNGTAKGSLYFDDGISIKPAASTEVEMQFSDQKLIINGNFGMPLGVKVRRSVFLDVSSKPNQVQIDGNDVDEEQVSYNAESKILTVLLGFDFDTSFEISFA